MAIIDIVTNICLNNTTDDNNNHNDNDNNISQSHYLSGCGLFLHYAGQCILHYAGLVSFTMRSLSSLCCGILDTSTQREPVSFLRAQLLRVLRKVNVEVAARGAGARDIPLKLIFQKIKPQPINKPWILVKKTNFIIQNLLYNENRFF